MNIKNAKLFLYGLSIIFEGREFKQTDVLFKSSEFFFTAEFFSRNIFKSEIDHQNFREYILSKFSGNNIQFLDRVELIDDIENTFSILKSLIKTYDKYLDINDESVHNIHFFDTELPDLNFYLFEELDSFEPVSLIQVSKN